MKKQRYKAYDKFALRTPLFPITHIDQLYESDSVVFKEAIYLSSPEFKSLIEDTMKSRGERLNNTLYRYSSRSCTRSTPFGIFAGCTMGEIGDSTKIQLKCVEDYKTCTRLDMQYISELIRHIESNNAIRPKLIYYANNSLYKIGEEYRYVECRYINYRQEYFTVSVEYSEYLSRLLEKAKYGLTISELTGSLVNDEVSLEESLSYVGELIDAQILVSELLPSVVGRDIFEVLLEKLIKISDTLYLPALLSIKQYLHQIDSLPIGSRTDLFNLIINLIDDIGVIYNVKYLFQVDMYKPSDTCMISNEIILSIQEALSYLYGLSSPTTNRRLIEFKRVFYDRYGDEDIDLLTVMDAELGLGYPCTQNQSDVNNLIDDLFFYGSQENNIESDAIKSISAILLKKLTTAIKDGSNSIILTEDDFVNVVKPESSFETLSVLCSVAETFNGNYEIFIKSIDNINSCSLLGRFCHMHSDVLNLAKEISQDHARSNQNVIFAEISHLPKNRTGNIVCRPIFKDGIIHYISNESVVGQYEISLSDLYVSIKNDRVVLYSHKLQMEIIPMLTCAHNYTQDALPLYYFLCDLSSQSHSINYNVLQWRDLFYEIDYLPRIEYKNIILSKQRWRVQKKDIRHSYNIINDDDLLLQYFQEFCIARKIPIMAIIPDGDNDFFVNFDDINSIKAALAYVKNREVIFFEEFCFSNRSGIVKDCNGDSYANEMIFFFNTESK